MQRGGDEAWRQHVAQAGCGRHVAVSLQTIRVCLERQRAAGTLRSNGYCVLSTRSIRIRSMCRGTPDCRPDQERQALAATSECELLFEGHCKQCTCKEGEGSIARNSLWPPSMAWLVKGSAALVLNSAAPITPTRGVARAAPPPRCNWLIRSIFVPNPAIGRRPASDCDPID